MASDDEKRALAASVATPAMLAGLRDRGFARLPNFVPASLVADALREINRRLGSANARTDAFKAKSFPDAKEITNLFNASALPFLMQRLLGGRTRYRQKRGQLALRFPGDLCPGKSVAANSQVFKNVGRHWHIDGCPNDFIPGVTDHFGTVHNFDCLVGILLSDVPAPLSGELCVWPGSHETLARWFSEGENLKNVYLHGNQALPTGKKTDAIFRGTTPVNCTGNAGDVFIANYMTAHFIAPNTCPNIRYAVYFRVSKQGIRRIGTDGKHDPSSMLVPWLHWDLGDTAASSGGVGSHDHNGKNKNIAAASAQIIRQRSYEGVPDHLLPSADEQAELDRIYAAANNDHLAPPSLRRADKKGFLGGGEGKAAAAAANAGGKTSALTVEQQTSVALVSSMLEEIGVEGNVSTADVVAALKAYNWDENDALGSFF